MPFQLRSTLGRSHRADLNDALRAKQALHELGYFKTPRWGLTEYPDEPLFVAIEDFQRDHGLSRDGIMRPEGETAARLGEALAELQQRRVEPVSYSAPSEQPHGRAVQILTTPSAFGLRGEVGEGRANDPPKLIERREQHPAEFETAADAESGNRDEQVAFVPQALLRGGMMAAPPLIGAAEMMRQKAEQWWKSRDASEDNDASARSALADPTPPTSPVEPPKPDNKEELLPTPIKPIDLTQPIPEDLESGIYIFPIPDEDLAKAGQIVEHNSNPETTAELQEYVDRLAERNPGWTLTGGTLIDRKSEQKLREAHIPGPGGGELGGKLRDKPKDETGDGRYHGNFADATMVSPDGKTVVHIQTVDADHHGKPTEREHLASVRLFKHAQEEEMREAINAKREPRKMHVILILKRAQIDKLRK